MDRKERIYSYICSKEYIPLRHDELAAVLDVPKESENEFDAILQELCDEGKIYTTKKGRYVSVSGHSDTVSGRLRCSGRGFFAFLICDDKDSEDVFIPGEMLGTALDGDRVIAKIDEKASGNGHRTGHVIKILERGNKTVVGVICKEKKGTLRVRPDKKQIYSKVRIKPEDAMGAVIGDRVAAEITDYTQNGKMCGRVLSVLGDGESLKSCIEGIIIGNGIKSEFPQEVLSQARKIPNKISKKDLENRTDLREQLIFTIDGDDARDFDDAVSLKVLENRNYYLGVHIADVSHYVTEGSPLDKEALERGTSVYLADRVIPMLPERLSNGICSLNPDEDRLTMSVFMEIDSSGEVLKYSIEKSVIRSKERMTYNNVTRLLEDEASELTERYKNILPTIKIMYDLAEILRKRREKRGAIQFDFPETTVIVDEEGNPVEIAKAERGVSNGIIEEFMLCANETVAEHAFWSEMPFVYRIHEQPSAEKILVFNEFIRNFGLTVKGGKDGDIHPKALQQVLDAVKGTPEERMVSSNMLHSLMKAEYNTENTGHFGLAAKYYCHFTSPIRRYPDLVIHRILKAAADGKEIYKSDFSHEAKRSSDCEIAAEYAERDVEELMKTAYMSGYIGEEFEGVVANVTNFGMFVELDNSIEGLVRAENMEGDYYEYDDITSSLTGKRTGITYKIGDEVSVVVTHTDILARQIDFVLARDFGKGTLKKFEKRNKPSDNKRQFRRFVKNKKTVKKRR